MSFHSKLLDAIIKIYAEKGVKSTMSENNSSGDVKTCPEECEFSIKTMVGIAIIGAASSATLYYIYTQLSKETKKSLKDMLVGTVKSKIESLTSQK